ncbi:ThiF family adenylyltransferase [Psychrobacter sp. FDAARGOS_221]|uniref:tRNA threonylcarbamoyladenosine dehydratase n=1 Tax=Psychrobacter sp. FDAARGOS_221 TaxID=1975705 RepID=UPI000BB5405F|nr:tRNA threonylcarbamoyladenosine dehydratase [Psychrobacter sp. FDAARGOS_221]PNK61177.1 tRNA threonylcarbamoyladenosine dehydratase [Psychrobacter sp. FDAARGOS_221]
MTNPISDQPQDNNQYDRRFQGTRTLYGQDSFANFEKAHVIVIGVGGVGTWVVEGLARTGVGKLTLIDMDVLVASNVNRQLPALDSTFGRSKIESMAERAAQINPKLELELVDDFLTTENVAELLPSRQQAKQMLAEGKRVVVLDCTDDMSAKLAIALHCRFNKLKLICAGGAGGKTDPLQITVSDLKDTYQDPLLARMRTKLRNEHGINKEMKEKFGIKCVYSTQPPIVNKSADGSCAVGGLHCGGYGSAVAITSVVGMVMVSETLALLSK